MQNDMNAVDVPEIAGERGESDTDYLRRCVAWVVEHSTADDGRIDRERAADLLAQLARRNNHLFFLITHNALPELCYKAVAAHLRRDRRDGWQQMTSDGERIISESVEADTTAVEGVVATPIARVVAPAPPVQKPNIYAAMGRSVFDLYSVSFTSGKSVRLGEARRSDLQAAIADAQRNVRGNARNALFWSRIAQRLPDDETSVRAALSEADVSLIAAGSERDVEGVMQSAQPALTD